MRSWIVVGLLFALASPGFAQPTFKLGVPPHLQPQATIELKGDRITRSAVKDDPGFRLQFHFQKDGKTIATLDARASAAVEIPKKEPSVYTVALELFYPSYKPGKEQKGAFLPISEALTFRVSPDKTELIPAAVVIPCGKDKEAKLDAGYGYKLLQGTSFDAWPKTARRPHCWTDAKELRFELTVPPATAGILRLEFLDGDAKQRRQRLTVQGKPRDEIKEFTGAGKRAEITLSADDVKTGKIEVSIQPLNAAASAVVSKVEFVPTR